MAITHTFAPSYRTGSGSVSLPSETITGDQEINTEVQIPANTTDYEVNIDFPHAAVLAAVLKSDKAVTVETNATDATGGDTVALAANKARFYRSGVDPAGAKIFTADVTKFYITNATSDPANFVCYILLDQVA